MLATAWSGDAGLITVAMTPCMRLYAFLGQKLAENGISEHQYSEWIQTYSQPEFEQLAEHLEGLTDRYTTINASVKSTLTVSPQTS